MDSVSGQRRMRLTRKELTLFVLPLLVFVFYFVSVRLRRAMTPPPNPQRFPASPAVVSPDGLSKAQVIRVEREPENNETAEVPDDWDYGSTGWKLTVTRNDGTQTSMRLQAYDRDNDEVSDADLEAMRKVPYQIAWDKSGRILTFSGPRNNAGKAIYLPACGTKQQRIYKNKTIPISPIAVAPDSETKAQVLRLETFGPSHVTEDEVCQGKSGWSLRPVIADGSTSIVLRVTGSNGKWCDLSLRRFDWFPSTPLDLAEFRKQTCRVAWDKSGQFVSYRGLNRQGSYASDGWVLYLRTCLRLWSGQLYPVRRKMLGKDAKPLTHDLRQRLIRRGCGAKEIARLKYVRVEGKFYGSASKDFVNLNPQVLVVAGPDYSNHGALISRGPILAVGEADLGEVACEQWIFLDDRSDAGPIRLDASKVFVASKYWLAPSSFKGKPVIVP